MESPYIIMIYQKSPRVYHGRKEYLNGGHSIFYNHANNPRIVTEMFMKDGESLDIIYYHDSETRVKFFRSLPDNMEELAK